MFDQNWIVFLEWRIKATLSVLLAVVFLAMAGCSKSDPGVGPFLDDTEAAFSEMGFGWGLKWPREPKTSPIGVPVHEVLATISPSVSKRGGLRRSVECAPEEVVVVMTPRVQREDHVRACIITLTIDDGNQVQFANVVGSGHPLLRMSPE